MSPEEVLERILRRRCPDLEREVKEGRILFFCRGSLIGSTSLIGERLRAVTVYSERSADSLHQEFLKEIGDLFGDRIVDKGTKTSTGVEGIFHYTYVHLREG